jgi:rhodanese-related sulfurtransferase
MAGTRAPPDSSRPVNVRNGAMIQGREALRFARERRKAVRLVRERVRQDLERDIASELRIAGAIHLPHSPFADRGDDVVDAEAHTGGQEHAGGQDQSWRDYMRPRVSARHRHARLPHFFRSVVPLAISRLDATGCHRLTQWDLANENQPSVSEHTEANEPPPIRQLPAQELKALLESGVPLELVDVRTDEERARAKIDGSRLLDQAYHDVLLRLDRETPIVFQCHHGVRSQQAAEYFRHMGFRNLYNLRGGIEAWSLLVDPSVPRY